MVSHSLRPYRNRSIASSWSSHHWNSPSLGPLQPRSSPGAGDVAVQGQVHAVDQFPHGAMPFCQSISGV
jgi:hypothetical protein